MLTFEPSMLL